MPDLDGIRATRTITATDPHVKVIVLTMLDDDESVFAAIRAGERVSNKARTNLPVPASQTVDPVDSPSLVDRIRAVLAA